MRWLSDNSVSIIICVAVVHFLFFLGLWWRHGKILKGLSVKLRNTLPSDKPLDDEMRSLDGTIECYLHDLREIILGGDGAAVRKVWEQLRILVKDKRHLHTGPFETVYNVVRDMIQAYPLMGILGTVLAIGVGLSSGHPDAAAAPGTTPAAAVRSVDAPAGEAAVNGAAGDIIKDFKNAIWSTVWGLIFGLGFMGVNAALEPSFTRLVEHRANVRNILLEANRAVSMRADTGGAA